MARTFANTVIIEAEVDDPSEIHTADDLYHAKWKKAGAKRTARTNHKGIRSVTFHFKNIDSVTSFAHELDVAMVKKLIDG